MLGSLNTALFQSEYSYSFSLKSPATVNPGEVINNGTMPIAPAKDMSKANFEPCQVCEFKEWNRIKNIAHTATGVLKCCIVSVQIFLYFSVW